MTGHSTTNHPFYEPDLHIPGYVFRIGSQWGLAWVERWFCEANRDFLVPVAVYGPA